MSFRPPEWFVRVLSLFDSGLHVRWGGAVGRWVVERDGVVPDSEVRYLERRRRRACAAAARNPENADKVALAAAITEETVSARRGRRVILYTKSLDNRIVDTLALRDIQRYGGYARAIIELESAELAAERDAERSESVRFEALCKETFDQINFVERRKMTKLMHGYSWSQMLESGSNRSARRCDGSTDSFTVVDRRTIKPEDIGVASAAPPASQAPAG